MNLIAALFFRFVPYWVLFIAAASMALFGFTTQQKDVAYAAARKELFEQAPPATIPITAFSTDAPKDMPVELSVSAQVALDHNTRLVRKTNSVTTGEDLMYVLVDPASGADINVAHGAIVIDPDNLGAFIEWMSQNTTSFGAAGPVVTFAGLRAMQHNSSHAYSAMNKQGMTIAPDFVFIEPFIAGREATLSTPPAKRAQVVWAIYGFAGLLALVGLAKFKSRSAPKVAPANPVPAGRGAGAYRMAEMQAGRIPPAQPAPVAASSVLKGHGRNLFWLAVVGVVVAIFTGQSWIFNFLPMIMVGLFVLGVRKGTKSLVQTITDFAENLTGKKPAPQPSAPASALPNWAAVQTPASAPTAQVSQTKPLTSPSRPKDDGPIRSGFSFADLLPKRKEKPTLANDPFHSLTQSIMAEKEKQRAARL
jgi:hypothetical protein